jgi:hypothetical protein
VNRIKGGLRIKEKARGFWAKVPFFLPDPGRGGRRGASVRRPGGGLQGPTAAGGRGKRRRGRRLATTVVTLARDGLRGWIGGGAPREAAALGVAAWWSLGRLVDARLRCGAARGWWCRP